MLRADAKTRRRESRGASIARGLGSISTPTTTCRFRWASRAGEDPLKAYVTIIEGCNEFCAFCVVPYTRGKERMRPVADILADVRHAADTGAREVQLLGQIVNHYQAPDDPSCDFAELLARVNDIGGVERIRFASPHPRHVTPRMIAGHARSAEGLPAPPPAGAERIDTGACRRCGGVTPARTTWNSSPGCARPCRTSRCRPI